jgi:hypothetical protein
VFQLVNLDGGDKRALSQSDSHQRANVMKSLLRTTVVLAALLCCAAAAETVVSQPQTKRAFSTNHSIPFQTISEVGSPPFIRKLPDFSPPALPPGATAELPSEQDPSGNWGRITEGFQLSLRLDTNRFTVGQTIPAYVILRNTSTSPLTYTEYGGIHARFCNFDLWDWAERQADVPHRPPASLTPVRVMVKAGTQLRTWANLAEIFDLTKPGRYSIIAEGAVRLLHREGHTIITSSPVEFEILPKPES